MWISASEVKETGFYLLNGIHGDRPELIEVIDTGLFETSSDYPGEVEYINKDGEHYSLIRSDFTYRFFYVEEMFANEERSWMQ